jgi:hypothetical protein
METQIDFEKVRAAILRRSMPTLSAMALEMVAAAPRHIMPARIRMTMPPVDAARRKPAGKMNLSAASCGFTHRNFHH